MFIQTETTPNPSTLKFIPGGPVLETGSAQFSTLNEARGCSPLAERLLLIKGVSGVFLGADFISVTLEPRGEWSVLKPLVLAALFEHLTMKMPILIGEQKEEKPLSAEDSAVVLQIRELLDLRIRPAVAQDGGDIVFHKFEKGILWLEMQGACSGCPSSTMTLKMGIENMMRHYIPEVLEVRAVMDD
ncbi:MAG: NifU family protein [Alphaproteobacteria bacterium]|nr:NifU family protein [Alphaproteobacteria bacterium]